MKTYISDMNDNSQKVMYLSLDELSNDEIRQIEATMKDILKCKSVSIPIVIRIDKGLVTDSIIGIPNFDNVDEKMAEMWINNTIALILKGE